MEFQSLISYIRGNDTPSLFLDFLIAFGRLDYGLKRNRTFCVGDRIKWDELALAFTSAFFDGDCKGLHTSEFVSQPPAKWSMKESRFVEQNSIQNTEELFRGLARLRNNLFHGSKGKLKMRDQVLVADGLKILHLAYDRSLADKHELGKVGRWMADVEGVYGGS